MFDFLSYVCRTDGKIATVWLMSIIIIYKHCILLNNYFQWLISYNKTTRFHKVINNRTIIPARDESRRSSTNFHTEMQNEVCKMKYNGSNDKYAFKEEMSYNGMLRNKPTRSWHHVVPMMTQRWLHMVPKWRPVVPHLYLNLHTLW